MGAHKGIYQAQKILDIIPGAVNPFSTRRLYKYMSAPIMRIRNGTTSAEGDIRLLNDEPSAAELSALLSGATPYLRLWYPQPSGTSVGNGTSGQQAQLSQTINGKYAIKFDGVDDNYNLNMSLAQPSLYFTLLMTLNIPALSSGHIIEISTNVGSIDRRLTVSLASGVLQFRFYDSANGGYFANLQGTSAVSGNITLAVVNNNKTITVQVNGVTITTTTGTSPATASPTGMFIGSDRGFTSYFSGSIAEIIPYERALTAAELAAYAANAMAFFSI